MTNGGQEFGVVAMVASHGRMMVGVVAMVASHGRMMVGDASHGGMHRHGRMLRGVARPQWTSVEEASRSIFVLRCYFKVCCKIVLLLRDCLLWPCAAGAAAGQAAG